MYLMNSWSKAARKAANAERCAARGASGGVIGPVKAMGESSSGGP